MPKAHRLGGSFRDPSGFLFKQDGTVYRQVNPDYAANYDLLHSSGLYAELTGAKLLISHQEVSTSLAPTTPVYKVLQPVQLPFISYPYEWSFSQLKDAALLTLELQKQGLARGMWLKDASATNIQFLDGRPILIDSLSFEAYPEGHPWTAYRQFCQHFLSPLALMAMVDVGMSQLLRVHLDGIPLGLAARLLPFRSRFDLGLLTHIHLHASAQSRFAGRPVPSQSSRPGMSRMALLGLVDHLERTINKLHWKPQDTAWGDYYAETNYTEAAVEYKQDIVRAFILRSQAKVVCDLGANTGRYSRIASQEGIFTISADFDPAAVELSYLQVKKNREKQIMPLVLDLSNPSASLGWANEERLSFLERGQADTIMALALVHHLAIGNNVPLAHIAQLFSRLGEWLIVEFVPKEDTQVQKLLSARKDIFSDYHADGFREAFGQTYDILEERPIPDSKRTMFLMKRHG